MAKFLVIDGDKYSADPGLYFERNSDGTVTASLQGNLGGFYQRPGIHQDEAVKILGEAMREQVPETWYDNLNYFKDYFMPKKGGSE